MTTNEDAVRARAVGVFMRAYETTLDAYELYVDKKVPEHDAKQMTAEQGACKAILTHLVMLEKLIKQALGDSKDEENEDLSIAMAKAEREVDRLENHSEYASIGHQSFKG